jgi:hypothetical protein
VLIPNAYQTLAGMSTPQFPRDLSICLTSRSQQHGHKHGWSNHVLNSTNDLARLTRIKIKSDDLRYWAHIRSGGPRTALYPVHFVPANKYKALNYEGRFAFLQQMPKTRSGNTPEVVKSRIERANLTLWQDTFRQDTDKTRHIQRIYLDGIQGCE